MLKPLFSADQQQFWDEDEKKGTLGGLIRAMGTAHPVKSVPSTGGFGATDKAVLALNPGYKTTKRRPRSAGDADATLR